MLNQVTNYTIVEDDDPSRLTHDVQGYMKEGWVPSGPLVIKDGRLLQVLLQFGSQAKLA